MSDPTQPLGVRDDGGSDSGVDVSQFISDGSINWGDLARVLVSSFVLLSFWGLSRLYTALVEVPAELLGSLFGWLGELGSTLFGIPEKTLENAWNLTADLFPIAGPADFAIGLIVLFAMIWAIDLVIRRAMEGV